MQADWYRIANFIMQAAYLPVHLFFIILLIRRRQPTPIWKWFILVVTGLWGLIAGRFMETCLHLFWINDSAYYIAVDITLISTTIATMSFLFWNLYIARLEKVATNKHFRIAIILLSITVCIIIVTNPRHHLFYSTLQLVGDKIHGKVFLPCVFVVYGMLFAGLTISIVHIIRHENNKIMRILVFSMYPILPGVTNLIRSLSGVDSLDFNPIVMSLSILCLYEIVFKKGYVGVISESIENVLNQTGTPIVSFLPGTNSILYENTAAKNCRDSYVQEILPLFSDTNRTIEKSFGKTVIRAVSSPGETNDECIASFTDISDFVYQREKIEEQLANQTRLLAELDEQKRNIEAYLKALYSIPDLKEKQEMTDKVQKLISEAFREMKGNLVIAAQKGEPAKEALKANQEIAGKTITTIREVVARLKEGM